jgi:hypothetical protein
MSRRLRQNRFLFQIQWLVAVLLPSAASTFAHELLVSNSNEALFTTIFSDDFNTGTLNTNKWRKGTNAGNKSGVANLALELRSQGRESGWIITRKAYKARNTVVKIKVVQPNGDGALGVSPTFNLASKTGITDQKNWYRFYTYRNDASGPYRLFVQWKKNGVENGLDVTGNLIITGAVYLRLHFDNTNIHFTVSLNNGLTWKEVYSEVFALPGYTLDMPFYYELSGYYTTVNGVFTVDDFIIKAAPVDGQAPKISQVIAQNITNSSAQINWQTDEPADSQVEYGLTGLYGNKTTLDSQLVTSHVVILTGLQANTTYHYRVSSRDVVGNGAFHYDLIFTTLPAPTSELKLTAPNAGEWWFTEENRNIKWTAANTIANVKLDYSHNGGITWKTIVASTPNDGAYNWRVPDSASNANLIRISNAVDPRVADLSDKTFFIVPKVLVNFTSATNNAVLSAGPLGSWDERITERGWFMYENGMYHVWYGGWKGNYDHAVKNFVKLGYAYSTDGIHWTKSSGNPIYSQHWTEDMAVVKSGNTYYMFAENEYTGDGDGATIDLYTSADKVHWTRHGVVLSPGDDVWDANAVGTPTVWKEANTWYMLYEGFGSGLAGQVGLATSLDGKNWSRHPQNPVLTNALGDQFDIAIDSIVKINEVYYAYGHYDTGGLTWVGGMFTSTDLIKWRAYPGNPFLDNSAVIVDNGVSYFMYGITSNPDALAPYYLKLARYVKDTTPPIISSVEAKVVNGTSVKINWKTNETADSQIEYGLTTSYGSSSPLSSTLVTSHNITLAGLQPNKTYHYRVKSKDEAGNPAVSPTAAGGDFSFKTPSWIFMDNFNTSALNANKWRLGTNTGNQSAVVDSALALRSQVTLSGSNENGWLITRNAHAARNTRVKLKVIKPNNDGALGMSPTYNLTSKTGISDQKNWYRFYTYRNGNLGPFHLFVQWKKNGVEGGHDVTGNLVLDDGFLMRLRFDNTNIHFEVSLDGTTWVDTYTEVFALPGYTLDSPFYYELSAYSTPTNGLWVIDDFAIFSETNSAAKSEPINLSSSPLPSQFALHNYPNPFNAATHIQAALPQEAEIHLSIFDLTGREVHELMAGLHAAGNYEFIWNGKNRHGIEFGSGIYLLRLRYRTDENGAWSQIVRRVMMIK